MDGLLYTLANTNISGADSVFESINLHNPLICTASENLTHLEILMVACVSGLKLLLTGFSEKPTCHRIIIFI